MKRLNNPKGSILVAITVLYILITLSMGIVLANVNEINYSRRYYNSEAAFWVAEAGVNMFMKNPSLLEDQASQIIGYGPGSILLTRDDSKPMFRLITSVGTVGKVQRKLQISYPIEMPEAYKNSISSKGDITITGGKTSVIVNDNSSISGEMVDHSSHANVLFENASDHVDPKLTSLHYPSSDPDGSASDSFQNFVQKNNELLTNYSKDEILYVKANETYNIDANSSLEGKKIVFIEGDVGGGNVNIESSQFLKKDQNLTVISTGNVTFHQSGFQPPGTQLNIIAWGGYNESVSAESSHRGIIYTHGTATFDKINESSTNSGSVIADGGIVFGDIWSTKIFEYADMTTNGFYPPGFEKLVGGSNTGIALNPSSWKEIQN